MNKLFDFMKFSMLRKNISNAKKIIVFDFFSIPKDFYKVIDLHVF